VAIAKTGRVNYTTMKDIPEDEQVLAGVFSLNGRPIIILFDLGASHDFISKAYAQKHQLTIEYMLAPYMISTPGGRIITRQVVVNPSLNLGG
jgi:predicted aspartyl protease